MAESFTCNVWDGCWAVEQSDEMVEWVLSKAPTPADSGVSPSAVLPSLQAAADIVAKALPTLTESGVPVVIALRTMATAISSIARSHGREPYGFAAGWPPETLALGFLSGALKFEWIGDTSESSCIGNLQGSLTALAGRFGFSCCEQRKIALKLDLLFCDAGWQHGSVGDSGDD